MAFNFDGIDTDAVNRGAQEWMKKNTPGSPSVFDFGQYSDPNATVYTSTSQVQTPLGDGELDDGYSTDPNNPINGVYTTPPPPANNPQPTDTPQTPSSGNSEVRKQVEQNLQDPMQSLEDDGLIQEAVLVEDRPEDFLDPEAHQAERTELAPVKTTGTVMAGKTILGEAAQAKVNNITAVTAAAAELPEAEQVQIRGALDSAVATAAQLPEAEQAQAIEDVMVQDFEVALVDPKELAVNLQRLKAEEPMVAASMTTEMNALLDGMENGDIPAWAKPAVTQVERQLAARGISASSIARDSLFNAIIQSAMPIAQQNAQFKQDAARVNYEAKVQAIFSDVAAESAAKQFNASSVNQKNQFMASLKAQVDNQNAARKDAMTQFNTAQLNDFARIQAQFEQDTNLSNAMRADEMARFNRASEDALAQFNAAQINDFAKTEAGFVQQANLFNAGEINRIASENATRQAEMSKFNAAQINDFRKTQASLDQQVNLANAAALNVTEQFNANAMNQAAQFQANLDQQREIFNSQQSQAIAQSNVAWRRQMNQINTAVQNQVNQTNVQNAFNLKNQALSFLWQEERDQAHWEFQADEAAKDRRNRLEANVIANETAAAGQAGSWVANITEGFNLLDKVLGS